MQISNIKYQNVIQKSKSIKNFAFYFVILIFAFCILNLNVYAYDLTVELPGKGKEVASLGEYLGWMFVFIISVAGILALLMIMIGGFQYITAGGNEARAGQGKNRIQNAIIGLILALCSYLILNTINPDLVQPSLPGLIKLNPSDFKWEDYLPTTGNPGDKSGDIPDGQECREDLDCYCSRKCQEGDVYFCPSERDKGEFKDKEECYAKTSCSDDPMLKNDCEATKSAKKYCTPLFDKEGKIGDKIACSYKCTSSEECYDNGYVCHTYYGGTCHKPSGYGEFCRNQPPDCEVQYICSNNVCAGTPPPQATLPNVSEPGQWPQGQGKGKDCKDYYYLIQKPVKWVAYSHLDSYKYDAACNDDKQFQSLVIPSACQSLAPPSKQAGDTIQCQPDKDILKQVGWPESEKAGGWLEVGYVKKQMLPQGIPAQDPLTCQASYNQLFTKMTGPNINQAKSESCEKIVQYCPGAKSSPVGDEYDQQTCCMIENVCCTPKSTNSICEDVLQKLYGISPVQFNINETNVKDCVNQLGLQDLQNLSDEELKSQALICCKVDIEDKTPEGGNCDPQKSDECCGGLVCKAPDSTKPDETKCLP